MTTENPYNIFMDIRMYRCFFMNTSIVCVSSHVFPMLSYDFPQKKHPMLSLWIFGSSKIPGAGRPSNESAGHWTRDGLLLQAGERKVEAELFPRAQAVRVGGADLGHEGLRNLDEGDDAVLFFVLMSILSPVLFFPFAGGCYVDVFSGGITS